MNTSPRLNADAAYLALPSLMPHAVDTLVRSVSEDGSDDVVGGRVGGENIDDLVLGLNPAQREAVEHGNSSLLVVAGAGSGKTRVLTRRVAYLIHTGRAHPGEILAITFTNKAAAEMRERLHALIGHDARRMWILTFHSACVRILREQHDAAGLKSTFTIYDAADSQRLIGQVAKDLNIDTKQVGVKLLAARISDLKNELISAEEYEASAEQDPVSRAVARVYRVYQARLGESNAVDFDDLIMRTVDMLRENPGVAEHYRRRFRFILVDEYQDTNHAQYVLVRELVGVGREGEPGHLTVVGDSDQSIYAFRGATIRNIEEFEEDFPGAHTVVLEQNYRSTQNILNAANAVISKNHSRRAKALWTDSGDGELIIYHTAENEYEEARYVVASIDQMTSDGFDYRDIAVFYRTNAQSRALEEQLVRSGIPYRVVGGTKFYERREIKDALAYVNVVANPDDTVSLRRIINTPRRGIGDKAQEALAAHTAINATNFAGALRDNWVAQGCPRGEGDSIELSEEQWEAAVAAERAQARGRAPSGISARAAKSSANLWGLIVTLRALVDAGEKVARILDDAMDATGYLDQLRQSEDVQDASRVDNLAELHAVALDFETTQPEGTVADFLERVALVADSDQVPSMVEGDNVEDARSPRHLPAGEVTLMTVHTAKGLEFPAVFITGFEDGTFPHRRSLDNAAELAEERRLAYVAITRARQRLTITRAESRSSWGSAEYLAQSRFIDDIPDEVRRDTRSEGAASRLRAGGRIGSSGYSGSGYSRGFQRSAWSRHGGDDDDFAPAFGSGRGVGASSVGSTPTAGVRRFGTSKTTTANTSDSDVSSAEGFDIGDRVTHATYGHGVVIDAERSGAQRVVTVDFSGTQRRLLLRYAALTKRD